VRKVCNGKPYKNTNGNPWNKPKEVFIGVVYSLFGLVRGKIKEEPYQHENYSWE